MEHREDLPISKRVFATCVRSWKIAIKKIVRFKEFIQFPMIPYNMILFYITDIKKNKIHCNIKHITCPKAYLWLKLLRLDSETQTNIKNGLP